MQTIIAVRHGEYLGDEGGLHPDGVEKVSQLAPRIKKLVEGKSVQIYSSLALRAHETAQIIAREIGVEVQSEESLGNLYGLDYVEKMLEWVPTVENSSEVLILVTHQTAANEFPGRYGHQYLGWPPFQKEQGPPKVGKGDAVLVDCQAGGRQYPRPV